MNAMYKDIQLDNNSNYQQYAPYDIIAVDESFHKLYDRKNRLFQYDDHNDLPLELLFNCAKKGTWEEAMNNGDWLKIETSIRNGSIVIRRFIHKSKEEEYLERTNGLLKWNPDFIYEIIVDKHRVTLTSNNYMDYSPRKMIAFASWKVRFKRCSPITMSLRLEGTIHSSIWDWGLGCGWISRLLTPSPKRQSEYILTECPHYLMGQRRSGREICIPCGEKSYGE